MTSDELDRLRAQMVLAADAAAKVMRPMVQAHSEALARLEPFLQVQRRFAEAMAPAIREVERQHAYFAEAGRQLSRQFEEAQARLAPMFEQLAGALEQLPIQQRRALGVLAGDGWYLDPEMHFPDLVELADRIEEGDLEGAREELIAYFEATTDSIESRLVQRFPARAKVIGAAMGAHRRGEYALSIPVFLAQADGICVELVGVQLYARRDGVPRLANHFRDEEHTPFMAALLHPLTAPMPISANASERSSRADHLNRHSVLHGESSNYDTRANGCRALSLLAYTAWILENNGDTL